MGKTLQINAIESEPDALTRLRGLARGAMALEGLELFEGQDADEVIAYIDRLKASLSNAHRGIALYRAKRMSDGGSVELPNGRRTQQRPWDAIKHYHAEIAVDEWEQEQERRER